MYRPQFPIDCSNEAWVEVRCCGVGAGRLLERRDYTQLKTARPGGSLDGAAGLRILGSLRIGLRKSTPDSRPLAF